jgi:hypothetical protein
LRYVAPIMMHAPISASSAAPTNTGRRPKRCASRAAGTARADGPDSKWHM